MYHCAMHVHDIVQRFYMLSCLAKTRVQAWTRNGNIWKAMPSMCLHGTGQANVAIEDAPTLCTRPLLQGEALQTQCSTCMPRHKVMYLFFMPMVHA